MKSIYFRILAFILVFITCLFQMKEGFKNTRYLQDIAVKRFRSVILNLKVLP